MTNRQFKEGLIIIKTDTLINRIFKKLFKIVYKTLIVFFVIIILGHFILNIIWFFYIEPMPNNVEILSVIENNKLDFKLEMYYDSKSNLYWLYSIENETKKKRLVMRDGDVNGKITVDVIGDNQISLHYDYFDNFVLNDKTIILNIRNNDVYKVTFIRQFLQR